MKFSYETMPVMMVELEGNKFEASTIAQLLDDLENYPIGTEGFGGYLVNPPQLREYLEKAKIVETSIRGASVQGSKYETFYKEFMHKYFEARKYRPEISPML